MKYKINTINLYGYHGIYSFEKKQGQNFKITVKYEDKNISNEISDDISNVIDYSNVINVIKNVFTSKRYNLIERLGFDIVSSLSNKFKIINIEVIITKTNPYNLNEVKSISCILND